MKASTTFPLFVPPAIENNVKALYVLTELQFGQSLPQKGSMTQSFAWILGMSMAF